MGHGNSIGIKLYPHHFKPRVTQFTRCHLNGNLFIGGILSGIEIDGSELNIAFLTPLFHKSGIILRLFPPKMEITMCRNTPVIQQSQDIQ
ncbi:hypothetical protein SDC9_111674 [bioreactor metagenome]|uniref:Uncharacterized protein n=1 Tax=bioreactor metagenome TaxID=1076179 RepID=A0A645BHD8_9ZZZZ